MSELDSHFFAHFAADGVFERFSRLDETGDYSEAPRDEGATTRQQDAVVALDEDDHCRCDTGIGREVATGAMAAALPRNAFGGIAATTAVLMIAIPGDDLGRSTGDCVMGSPIARRTAGVVR